MKERFTAHAFPVVAILVGFLVLGALYSVVVPLLEAPDEPSHVAMTRFLASTRALPVQRPPNGFPVGQEGSQPPLYYALGAAVFRLAPVGSFLPTRQNPHVRFDRVPGPGDNRNLYAHTPAEDFPWRGDVLGVHLVRLVGVVLGALTVLFSFLLATELFRARPVVPILAAALVAFNPQFLFISAVVNNDVAAAATSTLSLWLLARWIRRGPSRRLGAALGLALGLALLAKTGDLLLLPPAGFAFGADALLRRVDCPRRAPLPRRDGSERPALAPIAIAVGLTALVAGWWFIRNELLYGDPLGWAAMLAANAIMIRPRPLPLVAAVRLLWDARGTYWGAFGWTNLLFPPATYRSIDVAEAVAGVGLLLGLARKAGSVRTRDARRALGLALLAIWPAVVFGSLVQWVRINAAADQWRLLFPAAAAIGILLAVGVIELVEAAALAFAVRPTPSRAGNGAGPALVATLLLVVGGMANVQALRDEIQPAYVPIVEAPTRAPAAFRFGPDVELVDYRVTPTRIGGTGSIDVDLSWRAARPVAGLWSVNVAAIGEGGEPLAKVSSWPEGGRAPTTAWRPDQVYRDRYVLGPLSGSNQAQLVSIWLSLFDARHPDAPDPPVADARGVPVGNGLLLGQVKLLPARPSTDTPSHPVEASFGSAIDLIGYDADVRGDALSLSLYWRDRKPVRTSYTVFVHVLDAGGRIVAQGDSLPRGGAYPTTAWDAGETVRDARTVSLSGVPPGPYRVEVGIYDAGTGERLAATASGLRVTDDAVRLFEFQR